MVQTRFSSVTAEERASAKETYWVAHSQERETAWPHSQAQQTMLTSGTLHVLLLGPSQAQCGCTDLEPRLRFIHGLKLHVTFCLLFDSQILVLDLEPQAIEHTHIDIGNPYQSKLGDDITTPSDAEHPKLCKH